MEPPLSQEQQVQTLRRQTHVGFIVLVPTPQRRRDRYIVEVFDSFHRFLERMVQPAAIDRWAGRAIERVLPSFIQAYLTGVRYMQDITNAEPENKQKVVDFNWIPFVNKVMKKEASQKQLVDGLCKFIERAIGLDNEDFAPGGKEHYRQVIANKVYSLLQGWASNELQSEQRMSSFFNEQPSVMDKPMTSLRDVDEVGNIHFGNKDLNGRWLETGAARKVMVFMRQGVAEGGESGDTDDRYA